MENRQSTQALSVKEAEAITHLKQAIARGEHWYIALLQAVGLFTHVEEEYNGRSYRYLIDGEAFDCLLLAERLCHSVDGIMPEDEKLLLLFHGIPPLKLTTEEFKSLIGSKKYHQYLNYFYGVTVEEALIQAVLEEVRKERRALGFSNEHEQTNEVYQRIYGATRTALLKQFRRDKGYPLARSTTLTELKEFTYWLFKHRLTHCDKVRVASDTNKALEQLRRQCNRNGFKERLAAYSPSATDARLEVNPGARV